MMNLVVEFITQHVQYIQFAHTAMISFLEKLNEDKSVKLSVDMIFLVPFE
jgi:hypothetical protein